MSVHANGVHRQPGVKPDADQLARAIRDIELGLVGDDPAFARRLRGQARAQRTNARMVVALLVMAAVLLAAGLATLSWFTLAVGALAFVSAFAVDARHRHRLARSSTD